MKIKFEFYCEKCKVNKLSDSSDVVKCKCGNDMILNFTHVNGEKIEVHQCLTGSAIK